MSAICNAPYRLLMEDLGAGGTVSELISCHGINYGNERTRHMLKVDREKITWDFNFLAKMQTPWRGRDGSARV